MISHKYKCIFVHIPKCAGKSIENALGHFDGHTGRGGQDHRSVRMIESPAISLNVLSSMGNMEEVLRRIRHKYRRALNPNNKLTVTKGQYRRYFKFTVVRNPWGRAFSWYKNVMRDEIHKQTYGITRELSLTEFLQLYAGKGLLRPQTYWITDFNGEIPFDLIIRFENLASGFREATQLMNIPEMELPHEIKGSIQTYHEYYDQDSKSLIEKMYSKEIEKFGYVFDH